MSVIDENKIQVDESAESTIVSNMLLSSELKGYIEAPNYYFANNDTETRDNLDLLMLTHGYRKFVWKQVLNSIPVVNSIKPDAGLKISGILKDMKDKPLPNSKVRLILRDKSILTLDTLTDADGHFTFENLNFADTGRIVLQGYKPNGSRDIQFMLDKTDIPFRMELSSVKTTNADTTFSVNQRSYLQTSRQYHAELEKTGSNQSVRVLKSVTVKARREIPAELEHSSNKNGPGNADLILTSKQLQQSGQRNLYDVLTSRVAGAYFVRRRVYSRRASGGLGQRSPEMAVIIDGIAPDPEVGSGNLLAEIDPDVVESVEVTFGPHYGAIYGPVAANGAFIITTKRAKKGRYEKYAPGVFSYNVPGFYKAREFYSPQYDKANVNNPTRDLRSTIYWNPNILTDAQGRASVSFFNADTPGSYLVILEGIDNNGNIGRQQYRYKVE